MFMKEPATQHLSSTKSPALTPFGPPWLQLKRIGSSKRCPPHRICGHAHLYIHISISIYLSIYIYVCVYLYLSIYIYARHSITYVSQWVFKTANMHIHYHPFHIAVETSCNIYIYIYTILILSIN